MQKVKQMIVTRNVSSPNYGDSEEDISKFVDRVTDACAAIDGELLSISYANEDTAVIVYRESAKSD